MEYIGQIVGLLFALFLLRLAYKVFEKNIPQSSFIALLAVVILFCSFPWFQGFVKAWINSKVNSRLEALGQQVNDVQKTTGEMHSQLENHQIQINKHQQELDEVQLKIRNAQSDVANQQTNISQQYNQISAVQSDLASAQTNLDIQQRKISDVEYLVENIFSNMTTESIRGDDTNRVCHISTHGTVFFKLDGVPIKNSAHVLQAKSGWGNSPLFLNGIQFLNVISLNFSGKWDDWKDGEFRIEYVKDTRQTNTIKSIETTTNELILDHIVRVPFN